MNAVNFIISNIGEAFSLMSDFEVLPGISLLAFCIAILVIHTLFDIFWFGAKSFMKSDTAYIASKTRESRWNRGNKD